MSFSRRKFLKNTSLIPLTFPWFEKLLDQDQYFLENGQIDWETVRGLFPVTKWEKRHFNSGSAGVMPIPVQEHLINLIKEMNAKAPYKVWGDWQEVKKQNIERIAIHLNVLPDELMVVRNTTEALNMIIYGLRLNPGDEFIAANHDYPFALNAIHQRASRDGIVPVVLDIKIGDSNSEIIYTYEKGITAQTKAILLTFMTHRQGQILPIRELTKMAHDHGILVVLDAAHAFGQFQHDLQELDVDFYASSLHKWLNAPHGTGIIFAKQKHISHLMAHPSSYPDAQDSMNKYEHLGTRAFHQEIGISAALDFHDMIGAENKEARLHELKVYWTQKVKAIPGVQLFTATEVDKSCAVATFGIDGYSGGQIVSLLDQEFDIHAKSVGGNWGSGVRISVNLFTNQEDLDHLINAVQDLAKRNN